MPTRKLLGRALALTALAALPAAGFALPSPAVAAAAPAAAAPAVSAASAPQAVAVAVPTSFVDLPSRPLPSDHAPHRITVTYRNPTAADQTVAPQILVESPDDGPFLTPANVKLEVLSGGHWRAVPLGSQTGTLFTTLTSAKLVLHSHHTLTQHYRITVLKASPGTIQPRVALYG
ncbi:signal peptide protein [Kitasatospora sp. NPDC085464]|uniref:signal peptide protein n=1 Tax=Kitasatospora sp. NPDC085464 TaxID=3364063 RepID=UPI0037C96157